jgi:hypothetical protein
MKEQTTHNQQPTKDNGPRDKGQNTRQWQAFGLY